MLGILSWQASLCVIYVLRRFGSLDCFSRLWLGNLGSGCLCEDVFLSVEARRSGLVTRGWDASFRLLAKTLSQLFVGTANITCTGWFTGVGVDTVPTAAELDEKYFTFQKSRDNRLPSGNDVFVHQHLHRIGCKRHLARSFQ